MKFAKGAGLNRVTLAGRQLKIELSRPGGVRRARNSQQNLQALHSENSSSQTDLLNAGSLGSGEALPHVSGGSGGGGSGQVLSPSAGDLQAMFHNLMIQGAGGGGMAGQQPPPPPPPPPPQGGGNAGLHVVPPPGPGMSGPFMPSASERPRRHMPPGGGDSFSTPPDTPGAGGEGLDDGPLGPRRGWAPPPPPPPGPSSAAFSQGFMSDSTGAMQGLYSGLMKQAVPPLGHPPPESDVDGAYETLVSSMMGTGGDFTQQIGAASGQGQAAPPPPPPPPPPSDAPPTSAPISAPPPPPVSPQLPPLQAARGVSSPKQQQQQPSPPPPPPPPQLPPQPPPSGGGSPLAAGTPSHGGMPAPSPTLPATLAAAAASAAAALARDPTIPPEEHEARLHQHLLEQLGHMHRHAVGQMVMEQQAGAPMHGPPAWHMGGMGSQGGSPCSSLPHSPRAPPPPGHRGLHPLSGVQYTPSPPPPAPLSVDGDLMSPGRGSGRPLSPMHANGRSAPRPISARHSRSPLAGGGPHSTASSLPVRPSALLVHTPCRCGTDPRARHTTCRVPPRPDLRHVPTDAVCGCAPHIRREGGRVRLCSGRGHCRAGLCWMCRHRGAWR